MKKARLYYHTIQYIGFKRFVKHLKYGFRKKLPLSPSKPPKIKTSIPLIDPKTDFLLCPTEMSAKDIRAGNWTFIGTHVTAGFMPDWDYGAEPLWVYNLHYFNYAFCLNYEEKKQLVDSWIDNYTFKKSRVGWSPYPLSLRLRNWVKFLWLPHRESIEKEFFYEKFISNIAVQARFLWSTIENHLGGNHYLENLITLMFLSYTLPIKPFSDIGEKVRSEFLKELDEQILPDGGYFERSPMYHAIVLHHLLDLWCVAPKELFLKEKINKMIDFLRAMTHPDGEVVLFNDAAIGIAPSPFDLLSYAKRLGFEIESETPTSFPESGYYTNRSKEFYIAIDFAPIGPNYVPAHAHADFGTFEISFNGKRFITDSGTCGYRAGNERQRDRSTAAHNTVEINNTDQCECWAIFRVARRYQPLETSYKTLPDGFVLSSAHDGYLRLKGKPIHKRTFRWNENGTLLIVDDIEGRDDYPVVSRLHFAPGVDIEINGTSFISSIDDIKCTGTYYGEGELNLVESMYFPEFGKGFKRNCIEYMLGEKSNRIMLRIALDDKNESI